MLPLTIAFVTSRKEPKFEWFCESLARQFQSDDQLTIHAVDYYAGENERRYEFEANFIDAFIHSGKFEEGDGISFKHFEPKPTIWQGKHQITSVPWWAKSNALNSSIILCETPWFAMADDRSILSDHWLQSIREAMDNEYAVVGSYEKRANMKVENGVIIDKGKCLGEDARPQTDHAYRTRDWYGGSGALPLEWCLAVNGFSEWVDGAGTEDSMFGVVLRNSGFTMYYDPRMRLIEDRTPSAIEGALKRADKNPHLGQKAKSWAIVRAFQGKTVSINEFDIRNLRDRVLLNHEPLSSLLPVGSLRDWYDDQPIADME